MAANFAVTTSFRALDRISGAFDRMSKHGRKFGNDTQDAFRKASRSGSRFGDIVKGILITDVLKQGASAIWNMAKASIGLASDLTEVQNVVDTTFGPSSAEQINKWSKTAIQGFGISELQAKKFTGTLGALMKSSGVLPGNLVKMSTELSGLAGDFASFYNLNIEDAFEKIKSGISGETEPLKALGINMSIANLEAFALTQGMTKQWKAMTQAEQVQLRYNYLMKQSKDAQGDFSKTLSTSMANQQRVLETKLKQAGATIMKGLLPTLTTAMVKLNDILDKIDFDKLSDSLTRGVSMFFSMVSAIAKLIPLFAPLIAGIIAYNLAVRAQMALGAIAYFLKFSRVFLIMARAKGIATAAQWAFNTAVAANPIALMVAAIAGLIASLYLVWKYWDDITAAIGKAIEAFSKFIGLGSNEDIKKNAAAQIEEQQKKYEPISRTSRRNKELETLSKLERKDKQSENGNINNFIQAPNQNQAAAQSGSYSGTLTIKDETRRAQLSEKRRGVQPVRTELLGQQ